MTDNQKLAELLGWEKGKVTYAPSGLPYALEQAPAYDTDYNALAEVWKVLHEKGLWQEFIWLFGEMEYPYWGDEYPYGANDVYLFLTDPKGQVEAAIEVLEKEEE